MPTAGYSGTPLAKKLGIKAGFRIYVKNPPEGYRQLLEPLPEGVKILARFVGHVDLVHLFTKKRRELSRGLERALERMPRDGMVWVSWPKKASKVPSEVTEDVVRELALPLGLVDVKVCAVDETWSGLKLMIRKENR